MFNFMGFLKSLKKHVQFDASHVSVGCLRAELEKSLTEPLTMMIVTNWSAGLSKVWFSKTCALVRDVASALCLKVEKLSARLAATRTLALSVCSYMMN